VWAAAALSAPLRLSLAHARSTRPADRSARPADLIQPPQSERTAPLHQRRTAAAAPPSPDPDPDPAAAGAALSPAAAAAAAAASTAAAVARALSAARAALEEKEPWQPADPNGGLAALAAQQQQRRRWGEPAQTATATRPARRPTTAPARRSGPSAPAPSQPGAAADLQGKLEQLQSALSARFFFLCRPAPAA
jgi:hypothetical protein